MNTIRYENLGELKQALSRDYNNINVNLFSTGASTLRIDIFNNRILIVAVNKRILALERISEENPLVSDIANPLVSDIADYCLIKAFKKHFKQVLTEKYGFQVDHIFKDYDAQSALSATLAILDGDVERYLDLKN